MRMPTDRAHGIQVMYMCEAFARAGHDVTLLVPDRTTHITDDPHEFYGVEKNFEIARVSVIDSVSWGRLGFWLYQYSFGRACRTYLKDHKTDVVFSRDEALLAMLLEYTDAILVWESHMGRFNALVKKIMNAGVKLIVISNGLKEEYVSQGIPENTITVAHDAVSLEEFETDMTKDEARTKLDLPKNEKLVLYIGSLEDWKGYRTLLDASKLITNAKVVIVGGTQAQVETLNKEYPDVTFLGYQPFTLLCAYQKAADVLVIPNTAKSDLSAKFTSPLKVYTHMTSGVPIAASDVPSIREVLNESNAYFFEPDNPENLAQVIEDVIEKCGEERAAQAARDVGEYTWQKRVSTIIDAIL